MTHALQQLAEQLDGCLLTDRWRIKRRLDALRRREREGQPVDRALPDLAGDIAASLGVVEQRRSADLALSFPSELPISDRLPEIQAAIRDHQVLILCGETGSGKSTQLPKICLSLDRGIWGRIGHTQPRRIAARTLASRIATEMGQQVGDAVGYKVRFSDRVQPHTRIKLLTDGMLLAEVQQDRFLNEYDTLIIDEAHERSLNIDFLLGYLRQLLPKRPDLKVIITSATIDPQRFSRHFDNAPVIEVSGRTYPVEVRYQTPEEEGAGERDEPLQQALLEAVDELSRIDRGDILVFLSGEREIRETAEHLRKHKLQLTEVLPLYARQSPADQARIFNPSGLRRIILATNVAETSLTVPGIRYVIDAGFARISRYSHRSKIQRLPVERISRASADQRKGRCGRVAEGICIRLYSEEDFTSRADFTEPEIQRTNLASVILQMLLLGFGDIARFPFIDPPDSRLIADGYRVLEEIGAVDGTRRITRLGSRLARLPVDPRVGRMLLEAAHSHCLREMLIIAAALSVQDPRDRPMDKQQSADEAHELFKDPESDFIGYLKLWAFLEENRRHLTRRKFERLCREHFLSATRVREWHDIHAQLKVQMHELGYRDNEVEPGYEVVHRAILSGLLSHVGFRQERDYLGARNSRFQVFPGSGVFGGQPKWVVAAELVETTRLYARTVARVQPEWVESMAGHLLKRSYSEAHWQGKRGQVGAYEKVTLYGLTLVPRRRVNYGPINPVESRDLFIRFGLVEGDFHTRAPFWRHNRELIDHVHHLEAKSRRRDILVDEESIYQFYAKRVPEGIYSTPQFENWLRKVSKAQPKLLYMSLQDVMRPDSAAVEASAFPDTLDINAMRLPLSYCFEPGSPEDGVILRVPAAVLNQVSEGLADWLVPGLLGEKIIFLIKSLPKALRRNFVPAPDYAARCLALMTPSDMPLVQALAAQLKQMTGVHIPEDAWDLDTLPTHMRMHFQVLDAQGATVARGDDLHRLQQEHAEADAGMHATLPATGVEREGMLDWECGTLPDSVTVDNGGIRLCGFPALVDCGDSVSVRVIDSPENAQTQHLKGLRRLLMLKLPKEIRYLRKNLPALQQMRLRYAKVPPLEGIAVPVGKGSDIEEELVALIIDQTFVSGFSVVRSGEEFRQRLEEQKGRLMSEADAICRLADEVLDSYQKVRKVLYGLKQINWLSSINDMKAQLDRLVFRGFLTAVPFTELLQYPRFLKALRLRIDKLQQTAARDQLQMREMQPLYDEWRNRDQQLRDKGRTDPRIEEIRWMLEEWRISLFAQEVKTQYPVSGKRIRKRWMELGL